MELGLSRSHVQEREDVPDPVAVEEVATIRSTCTMDEGMTEVGPRAPQHEMAGSARALLHANH